MYFQFLARWIYSPTIQVLNFPPPTPFTSCKLVKPKVILCSTVNTKDNYENWSSGFKMPITYLNTNTEVQLWNLPIILRLCYNLQPFLLNPKFIIIGTYVSFHGIQFLFVHIMFVFSPGTLNLITNMNQNFWKDNVVPTISVQFIICINFLQHITPFSRHHLPSMQI